MSNELLAAWREEIAAELAATETELYEAELALGTATAGAANARREMATVFDALGRLPRDTRPANVLAIRAEAVNAEARRAETALAQARNLVAQLQAQITDRRRALEQLDAISAAPAAVDRL